MTAITSKMNMEEEFKLKKPLTPSGAGKEYYPLALLETLDALEEWILIERVRQRKPLEPRKRKWQLRPGAKNIENVSAEQILESVNIGDVISNYTQLRNRGDELSALCPFHDDFNPSLSVNPGKGFWYCFGCSEGGDVISFIMKAESIDFKEALSFLAERYNIGGVTK